MSEFKHNLFDLYQDAEAVGVIAEGEGLRLFLADLATRNDEGEAPLPPAA